MFISDFSLLYITEKQIHWRNRLMETARTIKQQEHKALIVPVTKYECWHHQGPATSTKMVLPQHNSGQSQLHLATIRAQPQHSSTEHPVSVWVHPSPSNPWTLDTISNRFQEGQERSTDKQIFYTQKPVPSPLLCAVGYHLPETLKSIWALFATFPLVLIISGKIAQQQGGNSTHLKKGEETSVLVTEH